MPSPFVTTRRVDFIDTDMVGIVHYSNFARYAEAAESEFFRTLDLHLVKKMEDGTTVGWPRVSSSFSFLAPAFFEDVLEIRIGISKIGAKSLTLDFEFRRDDTLLATGRLKTAYCRFQPGSRLESIAIPEEFLTRLNEYRVDADFGSGDHSPNSE